MTNRHTPVNEPARRDWRVRSLVPIGLACALLFAACGGDTSEATAVPSETADAGGSSATTASSAPTSESGEVVVGNGKKQFGWATGLNANSIISAMQQEMIRYAGEQGWEVLFDTGTNNDIQPMVTAIQAWITAGVPSITLLPTQPDTFVPLANQAIDAGLIWVAYGAPMEPIHGQVAFPPCDAAVIAADATVEWINKNATDAKVLITSSPANPTVACKWEDVQAAIEAETDATVVAVQEGTTQAQALEVTQATLQANPDLRVVVATNDDAAVGASRAFEAAGIDPDEVFIIGFDGLKEALEQIEAGGYIKASAALNLARLARGVVDVNIQLATTGQPSEPLEFIEPPVLVMKGDPVIDEILAFYESAEAGG